MSEIFTSISLRSENWPGVGDRGRKTRKEMIAQIRSQAAAEVAQWSKILKAKDSDFRVRQYRGLYVMRDIKEIE